jgi:hypothetical protein
MPLKGCSLLDDLSLSLPSLPGASLPPKRSRVRLLLSRVEWSRVVGIPLKALPLEGPGNKKGGCSTSSAIRGFLEAGGNPKYVRGLDAPGLSISATGLLFGGLPGRLLFITIRVKAKKRSILSLWKRMLQDKKKTKKCFAWHVVSLLQNVS